MQHRENSRRKKHKKPVPYQAQGPCEVMSWDITYLKSATKGMFYYLYLVVDIWSRKILAAEVYETESGDLGAEMFTETCFEFGIDPGSVLHSDNGTPMKSSTMLATLQQLGVIASFSRPHVSDDNPFSESLFRTLKYRPAYPREAFKSLEAAKIWVKDFVTWYNTKHLHSSIRFVTPDDRFYGKDLALLDNRRTVYEQAQQSHPERWTGATRNWSPIRSVELNPGRPQKEAA